MNGVGNDDTGVLVLGATNIPWQLDPAIKRRCVGHARSVLLLEIRSDPPLRHADSKSASTFRCPTSRRGNACLSSMSARRLARCRKRTIGSWACRPRGGWRACVSRIGELSADVLCVSSYSGSDIAVIVRDALMQPVRKVLSATHFKPVSRGPECPSPLHTSNRAARAQVQVPSPDDPSIMLTKLTPCSPGAPDAIEKAWTDVNSDELLEPPLTIADFLKAIGVNRKTVSDADVQKHIRFTEDSGGDGN